MGAIIFNDIAYPSGSAQASNSIYDNTESGLTANNLQDAVDEVVTELETKQNATDNSLATTAKTITGAINELQSGKQDALTNPLTQSDVVNNVTSTATNVPLSAAMGKSLKDTIDNKDNLRGYTGSAGYNQSLRFEMDPNNKALYIETSNGSETHLYYVQMGQIV